MGLGLGLAVRVGVRMRGEGRDHGEVPLEARDTERRAAQPADGGVQLGARSEQQLHLVRVGVGLGLGLGVRVRVGVGVEVRVKFTKGASRKVSHSVSALTWSPP